MMNVDAAFDRIGSALRQRGYTFVKEEKTSDSSGDRSAVFKSPAMSVQISWKGKARLIALEVDHEGGWVEFARRNFGPRGLEDTAVEALVRAIRNEVAETSTDSD
ncbi:MAG TPA: hypothetical protein VJ776_01850 [Thermoanaerobaculia bacterium]|nr:hypothetical protein [Thermoanaerobaculia bacterium]